MHLSSKTHEKQLLLGSGAAGGQDSLHTSSILPSKHKSYEKPGGRQKKFILMNSQPGVSPLKKAKPSENNFFN